MRLVFTICLSFQNFCVLSQQCINVFLTYYNVFGRFLFNVLHVHSRTTNLGEVSSTLLGAQLSLALGGLELTGLGLLPKLDSYILHSN
jgi:hypothetical protein